MRCECCEFVHMSLYMLSELMIPKCSHLLTMPWPWLSTSLKLLIFLYTTTRTSILLLSSQYCRCISHHNIHKYLLRYITGTPNIERKSNMFSILGELVIGKLTWISLFLNRDLITKNRPLCNKVCLSNR
jgi:hypothetical protein